MFGLVATAQLIQLDTELNVACIVVLVQDNAWHMEVGYLVLYSYVHC